MTGFVDHAWPLPVGAEIVPGGTRFRLWAPAAPEALLVVEGQTHCPRRGEDGMLEAFVPGCGHGARYAWRLPDGLTVPDPASRWQPDDVMGPSAVVDPRRFAWPAGGWRGRPWHETVLYELHVGTMTAAGTFAALIPELDALAATGITAIELMPVADFSGRRGWGYDGVLPFAPDSAYGTPEDLKRLIAAAHARGLMVFLDVVYNHFGPEGNFLHAYAPQFFTERHHTPWGAAIDFSRPQVRQFFVANALYWLMEYRFDGLRLDAVHAIRDDSRPDILEEIAATVRRTVAAREPGRHVHLVLENDDNASRYLHGPAAGLYDAQWNDDFHHIAHHLATGEAGGYYEDHVDQPVERLARALLSGFDYQGTASRHRGGRARGERSAALPSTAMVNFIQNHDQIGNRALGERLETLAGATTVEVLLSILLLSPQVPLLFMGDDWGTTTEFLYFCDFTGPLAEAVREGRRREFGSFPQFSHPEAQTRIPDPNDPETARRSRPRPAADPRRRALVRRLLELRHGLVVPGLAAPVRAAGPPRLPAPRRMVVAWRLGDGRRLTLSAQLGSTQPGSSAGRADPIGSRPVGGDTIGVPLEPVPDAGPVIFAWPADAATTPHPWACLWQIAP